MRASRHLAVLLLGLALAACGQKGPLYLPDAAAPKQQPAPAPTTTPEKPKQDDPAQHDGGPQR